MSNRLKLLIDVSGRLTIMDERNVELYVERADIPDLVRTLCPEIDALREVATWADAWCCNGCVIECSEGHRCDVCNLNEALEKLRAARGTNARKGQK